MAKAKPRDPSKARFTTDETAVFKHLSRHHGIDPRIAGNRLHEIKKTAGRGPTDDVQLDWTGNVYSPETGEWLGSLTTGGVRKH